MGCRTLQIFSEIIHTIMVLPFGTISSQPYTGASLTMPTTSATSLLGHTSISTSVPIIPSPYIDFIIVNGDDRYMIRCERKAVLENSVQLAKLIHAGPNSGRKNDNHFLILNVDKYDFELLIRFLETKFVKFRDHLHILKILELADHFNCPDLVKHCIRELDLHLSSKIVIDVFRSLSFYHNLALSNHVEIGGSISNQITKAKPIERKYDRQSKSDFGECNTKPFTVEDFGAALLNNTLQLIDMHAELVLTKHEMAELRFDELRIIAERDTLMLSSELVLYNCLSDYSLEECKRKNMDLCPENRRRVLGPLCYAPRYLLMSSTDFGKACARVELLDATEIALVREILEGDKKKIKDFHPEQIQLLERFRTPRPEFPKMPIHLSDRSNPKKLSKTNEEGTKTIFRSKKEKWLLEKIIIWMFDYICLHF